MTKRQAIEAMKNGAKVTHSLFADDEFIRMDSDVIYDESNFALIAEEFWTLRNGKAWDHDWLLYQPKT